MEEMKKSSMCANGTCICPMGMHHGMMRRIAMLFIIVFVSFWCGLKLGEIKGFIMAGMTGQHMMMRMDRDMMYDRDMQKGMMMKTESVPATPVAPTSK